MGQIESSELSHNHNNGQTSDRRHNQTNSGGSDASNETKVNFGNDSPNVKEDESEDYKEKAEDPRLKKAKSCDFACTIFFAMVGMLVFSTMSRTYTTYSGGGCGKMYGVQSLLAYTCVGLACAIIRSLRKQIKQQIQELSGETKAETAEEEVDSNSMNYHRMKETEETKDSSLRPKAENYWKDEFKRDSLLIDLPYHHIQPYSGQDKDKLSTGLPLPALPPMNALSKQLVPNSETKALSQLSAVDLKAIDTDVAKQHVQTNDKEYEYPIDMKEWNDFLTNKDRSGGELGNHKQKDCNWNDYNLNAIDKYI